MADKSKVVAVEVRDVFGVRKAYPANETAIDFAALIGCKTLPAAALKKIERIGFKIVSSANASLEGVA